MSVVIVYQSLNSNSSTTHDFTASTAQLFTRQTHKNMANMYRDGDGILRYPTNSEIPPHVAIQGPAELIPLASADAIDSLKRKRDDSDSDDEEEARKKRRRTALSMVDGKARQIYQGSYRGLSQQCDLIVFGELDSTHPDWSSLVSGAGKRLHSSIQPKACNCFSMHSTTLTVSNYIAEGTGWFAAECKGVVAVFVHVPNSLATDSNKAKVFYNDIKNELLNSGGKVVDVIIGDTNQPREMFSSEVISAAMDKTFKNAHQSGMGIVPTDTYSSKGVKHIGTNSANSKVFDVAVYNTETVKTIDAQYISQMSFSSNKAMAYTDHMGIMVKITKK